MDQQQLNRAFWILFAAIGNGLVVMIVIGVALAMRGKALREAELLARIDHLDNQVALCNSQIEFLVRDFLGVEPRALFRAKVAQVDELRIVDAEGRARVLLALDAEQRPRLTMLSAGQSKTVQLGEYRSGAELRLSKTVQITDYPTIFLHPHGGASWHAP